MKQWSITEQEFQCFRDGGSMFVVHLTADTEEEIPDPQPSWLPDSTDWSA